MAVAWMVKGSSVPASNGLSQGFQPVFQLVRKNPLLLMTQPAVHMWIQHFITTLTFLTQLWPTFPAHCQLGMSLRTAKQWLLWGQLVPSREEKEGKGGGEGRKGGCYTRTSATVWRVRHSKVIDGVEAAHATVLNRMGMLLSNHVARR